MLQNITKVNVLEPSLVVMYLTKSLNLIADEYWFSASYISNNRHWP